METGVERLQSRKKKPGEGILIKRGRGRDGGREEKGRGRGRERGEGKREAQGNGIDRVVKRGGGGIG